VQDVVEEVEVRGGGRGADERSGNRKRSTVSHFSYRNVGEHFGEHIRI
jgi:hypothetical protein